MSKNTTDLNILDLAKKLQCHSHGYMCQDCPQPDETEIVKLLEQLISIREKLAYRNGYAAGNAKKNYRKKIDAETVEQLKTEITAGVLATLRKELDREEPTHDK